MVDGGYLPTTVLRMGIRSQLRERINIIASTSLADSYTTKMKYVDLLRTRPIAIETDAANTQHYEVGTGVLQACLGPRMKYSCCLYPKGGETLAQAEIAMLESYVKKAELKDGMKIFDLGFVETPSLYRRMLLTENPAVDGARCLSTSRKSCPTRQSQLSPTPKHKSSTSIRRLL